MSEIHSQQTSGVDPWQAINERYGFVATDYLIDSTGMGIDELMSHWLKERPLDRSRSLGPV